MVAVVLSSLVPHGLTAAQDPVVGPPTPLPGVSVPLPAAPSLLAWTVDLPAPPAVSPLITGELVIVAHVPGFVAAYARTDGRLVWRAEIASDRPLATDGPLVYVAAEKTIHALRLTDGSEAWRVPGGASSAPLVAKDGWLLTPDGNALSARRAADGAPIWTLDVGPQRESSAISGDMVVTPLADGRLVARDLLTGAERWTQRLGGAPGPPAVIGDDIFVGASNRFFYCVDAASGRREWAPVRVGAMVRGSAAADAERVYFTALDNQVHARDRWHGALRWQTPVAFRPLTGVIAAGSRVFVAGPDATVSIRILDAATGRPVGGIAFPDRLAAAPGFLATDGDVVFAAVTGTLGEAWRLSLTRRIAVPTAPPSR